MVVTSTVFSLLEMNPADLRIALIGASRRRHKFGAIILADLVAKGFEVWPVNPKEVELNGRPVVATVDHVPDPLHIVSVVVPPHKVEAALAPLDPDRDALIWFQPGSYDEGVLKWVRGRFDQVLVGPCVMVETQGARRR